MEAGALNVKVGRNCNSLLGGGMAATCLDAVLSQRRKERALHCALLHPDVLIGERDFGKLEVGRRFGDVLP
jgi:hypothetical protein